MENGLSVWKQKKTPASGKYPAQVIENNENVRKLLYYGFGGPAAYGEFAADADLKTAICPDDPLTNDDIKYLLTHIFKWCLFRTMERF